MGIKAFDKANPSTKQLEIYNKFDGGINTELADSILGDNEFREIINFDMDAAGSLKKRPGLYRLPGLYMGGRYWSIGALVSQRLQIAVDRLEIFNGWTEDKYPQKIPTDLTDLQIIDVYNFFDGAHWVFNYLTNKGLVTLLLDELMQVSPKMTEENWRDYIQFYKYGDGDVSKYSQFHPKISAYNDTWVLTISASNLSTIRDNIQEEQTKQVLVYNWNPITDPDYTPPENNTAVTSKGLKPKWLEAQVDKEALVSTSKIGDKQAKDVSSKFAFRVEEGAPVTPNILNGRYIVNDFTDLKYNLNYYNGYDVKVYYRGGSTQRAYFDVWRRPNAPTREEWDSSKHYSQILLRHPNGNIINPPEVYCIVYQGYGRFVVYLNNQLKYTSDQQNKLLALPNDPFNQYIRMFSVEIPATGSPIFHYPMLQTSLPYNTLKSSSESGWPRQSSSATKFSTFNSNETSEIELVKFKYYKHPLPEFWSDTLANTLSVSDLGVVLDMTLPLATVNADGESGGIRKTGYGVGVVGGWRKPTAFKSTTKYYNDADDDATIPSTKTTNVYWKGFSGDGSENNTLIQHPNDMPSGNLLRKFQAYMYPLDTWSLAETSSLRGEVKRDVFWRRDVASKSAFTFYYSRYASRPANGITFSVFNKSEYAELTTEKVPYSKPWLLNNVVKKDFLGFGSTVVTGNLVDKESSTTQIQQFGVACGYYAGNEFVFETPTPENTISIYTVNGYNVENKVDFFGSELFNEDDLDDLEFALQSAFVTNLRCKFQWQIRLNPAKSKDTALRAYDYFPFIDAIKDTSVKRFRARGVVTYLPDPQLPNSTGLSYLVVEWMPDPTQPEVWKELFRMDSSIEPNFNKSYTDWVAVMNTLKIRFLYEYISAGDSSKTLSYEQLLYVKPNLSDLSNIWYNLNLFDMQSYKTWPDIYDTLVHTNISQQLMEYPKGDLQGRKIQLFGLMPVNDVILQPGKQHFQLFYQGLSKTEIENLKVAITAMSIADYTAMINSPDYSTTGYKGEGQKKEPTTGPNWRQWNDVFKFFDDDPNFVGWDSEDNPNFEWQDGHKVYWGKKAIFELEVPATTEPYMILVQVCEFKTETIKVEVDGKEESKEITLPDLATVQETKVQMQPTTSYRQKINISNLFKEYTATCSAINFSTSLVHFGNTNKLFFSDSAVPSYFPLSSILQMKTPEAIQSCTIFQNKLIVSSQNSKFYIGGSSFDSTTDPYYIREIASDTGLLASKSEVPLGNFLYFLDSGGIKILKNLYGTADKEFAFENIDTKISSIVPKTSLANNAVGVAYDNKYYLNFPEYNIMLVYNTFYKAWVVYEGEHMRFSKLFVRDNKLYAVSRDTFDIYEFRDDVYVDNWNEIEDGYGIVKSVDGTYQKVQNGTLIKCVLKTKNYDQSYLPHRKKYDWALIGATSFGGEVVTEEDWLESEGTLINHTPQDPMNPDNLKSQVAVNALVPYVYVDNNLINYNYRSFVDGVNMYHYEPVYGNDDDLVWMPDPVYIRNDSLLQQTAVVANDEATYGSRLGENINSYYNIPIQRKGNTISFGLVHKDYTGITLDAIVVRFSLAKIRKNRGRQS